VRIALARIKEVSATTGAAVLIVEQKVREVLRIADRAYMLTLGEVAFQGTPDQIQNQLQELYLA
jgi:ABC-type branched-subunit amino acid transport system ATPase component